MPFTVGEAARRANLTRKAVRLYEERGLLEPVIRSAAGYRLYTDHDVQILRFIAQTRALGLSLDTIRQLVELRRDGTPPSREVLAILHSQLRDLDQKLTDLTAVRADLSTVFEHARSAVHN